MTGKRVYTKHVRNGKELPELNRDNHYSPHFQEIRRLQEPVDVLPVGVIIFDDKVIKLQSIKKERIFHVCFMYECH